MGFEIMQTQGKYTYIYYCESYRNENGQPRQRRTPIGKVDPKTGRKIYKPEYLQKLKKAGLPVEADPEEKQFSANDIKQSSVRYYGLFFFFCKIAKRIGLTAALESAVPDCWQKVFMLACYMIASGDPFMYCADWLASHESYPVGELDSRRISELLQAITPKSRELFYQAWRTENPEDEYLALDITSHSSYSELILDVEWGYNRDKEKLPQINLCMLTGENSRLPLYQASYSGSLKDVSTLQTTLSKFNAVTGGKPVTVVMDKGFYSYRNVTRLLGNGKHVPVKFIIAVPFTAGFATRQVESESKDIDCIQNTIVVGGEPMRAVMKERVWKKGHKVFTHIYYNARKAGSMRENLYAQVALLRDAAEKDPAKYTNDSSYTKYLHIRKSEKQESGYTVNIREDVVSGELKHAGWLVLVSNDVSDVKKAIRIYRDKDVVEKTFLRLKNSIDLGRLRVHSDEATQNKLFVGFIASIIMAKINIVMSDQGMYKKYTMKELLKVIEKQRIQDINGQSILYPVTKAQRTIYEKFAIAPPEAL